MKIKKIKISDIKVKFGDGHSPKDEKFIQLYMEAIKGKLPYHWALVQKEAIQPFSDFKPKLTGQQKQVYLKRLDKKDFPSLHVYEEGGKYIMSDDYHKYYFYLELGWPEIPCFIIGKTTGKFTRRLTKVKTPKTVHARITKKGPS
ncbi:hypothetical protein HQ584_02880 [Patescibacteria group bacterium]|nr:hypothetical protein [Patescibacteria group bacterium]